jgi:hypothetical protein
MNVQYADDQLQLLDDLKFVLQDRDDQLSRDLMLCDHSTGDQKMGDHLMVYHYSDEMKMDDLRSIPLDLMQLHHVIRQNVPMKDVKKVDQNLDGQKMNAPRIRRVKMKVGMNYYGHY